MSILVKTITIPKNTSIASALRTKWKIIAGLIYKFEIDFPPGPSGLVGIAVVDGDSRLYPFGEMEYFIGDNATISFEDEHIFTSATATLDILAYNLDDFYDHTIQVRVGILSDETMIKAKLGISSNEALTEPLQKLIELLTLQQSMKTTYNTEVLDTLK